MTKIMIRYCLYMLGTLGFSTMVLAGDIPLSIANQLDQAGIGGAEVAVFAQRVDEPAPLISHNTELPFNPASVMKLVTSFAAFEQLGINYHWQTGFYSDGNIDSAGQLFGNLYIKGSGDPAFGLDRLVMSLRELRTKGLQQINGNIFVDRSVWKLPPYDPNYFDGAGDRPYNVGADALMLAFNSLAINLVSGTGKPAVMIDPPLTGVNIVNELTMSDGDCGNWDDRLAAQFSRDAENKLVLRLTGQWRNSCGERTWYVAPVDPLTYAKLILPALWQELGGEFAGEVQEGVLPSSGTKLLVDSSSPTLPEVLRDMNKWSNNMQARQVLASIGATSAPDSPDTIAAGIEASDIILASNGISTKGLIIDNGAGLSRSARLSALSCGQLLLAAWKKPWMPEFIATLPVAGIDGTARKRLSDSGAHGFVHIKTGTLNGVRAMAGYVLDNKGRRVVVVMMVNSSNAAASRATQDALLDWIWQQP